MDMFIGTAAMKEPKVDRQGTAEQVGVSSKQSRGSSNKESG